MADNKNPENNSEQSGITNFQTDFRDRQDDFEDDDYDGFDDDDDDDDEYDDGIVVLEDNFEEVETDSSEDDTDSDDDHIFSSQREIEFSQNSEYYSDLNQKVFPNWTADEPIGKDNGISYQNAYDIIAEFVDLPNPRFVSKLETFFLSEIPCRILINFISRLPKKAFLDPKNEKLTDSIFSSETNFKPKFSIDEHFIPFSFKRTSSLLLADDEVIEPEEEKALKRSSAVISLLLSPGRSSKNIIEQMTPTILSQLSYVFHPEALGSIIHFRTLFESLLTTIPQKTLESLKQNSFEIMRIMFHFTHIQEVSESICTIFSLGTSKKYNYIQPTLQSFFRELSNSPTFFLPNIFKQIISHPNDSDSRNIGDFVSVLIDKLLYNSHANLFFENTFATNPDFVQNIINVFQNNQKQFNSEQIYQFLRLVLLFLKKSQEELFDFSNIFAGPQKIDNNIAFLRKDILSQLLLHSKDICDSLVKPKAETISNIDNSSPENSQPKIFSRKFYNKRSRRQKKKIRKALIKQEIQKRKILYFYRKENPNENENENENEKEKEKEKEKESQNNDNNIIVDEKKEIIQSNSESDLKLNLETIQIVEIIAQIADFELELHEFGQLKDELLFSSFTFELWGILMEWFFSSKKNNIYHNLFYRIFDAAVKLEHKESLEIILFKTDFVTRLITTYQEQIKTNRHCLISGFIILFCNVLRLKSQTLPKDHYLPKFLNDLQIWKDFEETLNIETSRQLPNTSRMISKPHFSPKLFENKEINYHIPGHGLGSGYC